MDLDRLIEDVLAEERTALDVSWVSYAAIYQSTWLASHLRLVMMIPDEELSLAALLYFALGSNRYAEKGMAGWLQHARVREIDAASGRGYVEQALSDLEEGGVCDTLIERELGLMLLLRDGRWFEVETGEGPVESTAPYEHGITSMILWHGRNGFYLLELHHES